MSEPVIHSGPGRLWTVVETPDGPQTAYLEHHDRDGVRVVAHTFVPKALEGRGLGGKLVLRAFEQAEAEGLKVRPDCWFAARFVEKNPAWARIVVTA